MNPDILIQKFGMQPHPEGGHYAETFRDQSDERGTVSCIYFLLKAGEVSAWHRIDATEIWHFVDGAPLTLTLYTEGGKPEERTLGNSIAQGEEPHIIIAPHEWQSARSNGAWTLISCIVAPAFNFEGFEMLKGGTPWQNIKNAS